MSLWTRLSGLARHIQKPVSTLFSKARQDPVSPKTPCKSKEQELIDQLEQFSYTGTNQRVHNAFSRYKKSSSEQFGQVLNLYQNLGVEGVETLKESGSETQRQIGKALDALIQNYARKDFSVARMLRHAQKAEQDRKLAAYTVHLDSVLEHSLLTSTDQLEQTRKDIRRLSTQRVPQSLAYEAQSVKNLSQDLQRRRWALETRAARSEDYNVRERTDLASAAAALYATQCSSRKVPTAKFEGAQSDYESVVRDAAYLHLMDKSQDAMLQMILDEEGDDAVLATQATVELLEETYETVLEDSKQDKKRDHHSLAVPQGHADSLYRAVEPGLAAAKRNAQEGRSIVSRPATVVNYNSGRVRVDATIAGQEYSLPVTAKEDKETIIDYSAALNDATEALDVVVPSVLERNVA